MNTEKPFPVMNVATPDKQDRIDHVTFPFVILLQKDGLVAGTNDHFRYSGLFIDHLAHPSTATIRIGNIYTDEFEPHEVTRLTIEQVTDLRIMFDLL